ncbi:BMC domain-containing protein [Neobacillus mesonae]|uniref:BMC domain-containing protein n=1 Tax=Neobacillus mesonae TaxID=1193713 RepID=A0A3T0I058_9BACI|nr:BMC domain-containing protein [Neobacillus mesonae]AZU62804.1 BMC domain-containing protein [Neobacillus mesonae]
MKKHTYALGMVETIGFPAMVAAADAAAKAADVMVTTYQKADSGIVTIYIIGDVASVKSAVDVGTDTAKIVGQHRHSHVIPRPDENVIQMLFPQLTEENEKPSSQEVQESSTQEKNNRDLNKKNLQELREIAHSLEHFPLSPDEIAKTKKEELIQVIVKFQTGKGGDK